MECAGEHLICLICGKDVNSPVQVSSESAISFKRGFQCFCQLINFNGNGQDESSLIAAVKDGGSGLEEVAFRRLPCCVECQQVLDDIHRLQEAIDKLQAVQRDRVEGLKLCLLSAEDDDEDSGELQIRKQLVTCILNQDPLKLQTDEVERDFVVGKPKKPRLEGGNEKEEPPSCDDDDGINSANDQCDDYQSGTDFLKSHPGTERNLNISVAEDTGNRARRMGDVNNPYFSKLSDSLLFYNTTVIKVTSGEGVFCQEPGCSAHLATTADFDSLEAVKAHVNLVHVGHEYLEKLRECPLCGEMLQGGLSFRMHLLSKLHGRPPYICSVCWKPYSSFSDLTLHLRTHRGSCDVSEEMVPPRKKFGCDKCSKEFYQKRSLAMHKDSHLPVSQRRRLSCDHCPKKLMTRAALHVHIQRFHQTRKYRICHICNKQYGDAYKLGIHMKSHGTLPPHICDQCGKSFHAPEQLKTHLRVIHPENDFRYQCEYCEMSYKDPRGLRRHQRQRHKDKVPPKDPELSLRQMAPEHRPGFIGPKIAFPCQFCEKPFPLKCRLTQHLKKYHADMLETH